MNFSYSLPVPTGDTDIDQAKRNVIMAAANIGYEITMDEVDKLAEIVLSNDEMARLYLKKAREAYCAEVDRILVEEFVKYQKGVDHESD